MDKKILILLVVVLILAGVVFMVTQKKPGQLSVEPVVNSNTGQNSQGGQQKPSETKNFEPVKNDPDYVWFPVPELGIEIKTRKDIAVELLYKIVIREQSEKDILSAEFTTKKLIEMGERKGYGKIAENGGFVCGIGGFARYKTVPTDFDTNETYEYVRDRGTYVDNYFVSYASPQDGCSSGPNGYVQSDVEYEQSLVQNWPKRVNGISEPLTESIRKIK